MADTLWKLSAVELARAVHSGELAPSQIVEAVIARYTETEPHLNAFATFDAEGARETARQLDARPLDELAKLPLAGVPFSVKDLIPTKGLENGCGSFTRIGSIPDHDAVAVKRMRDAGAVLLGKTTTPEFGSKAITHSLRHGYTRNPWDLERTPGGSSGGAAAALAAGVGPVAISTDGAGSSRFPASCCGILGMKATIGALPNDYIESRFVNFQGVGINARTSCDMALLFSVMNGPEDRDPWSLVTQKRTVNVSPSPASQVRGLRVMSFPRFSNTYLHPEVERLFTQALARLVSWGGELITGPVDFDWAPTASVAALTSSMAARFGDLIDRSEHEVDPVIKLALEIGRSQTAEAVARAPIQRTQLFERVQELFQDADIIASPTLAAPPVPFDQNPLEPLVVDGREIGTLRDEWTPYGGVFNQTGHPAISIQAGFTSDGLPVGIQIAGRYNTEQLLLDLAAAMEQETKWPESWPKI